MKNIPEIPSQEFYDKNWASLNGWVKLVENIRLKSGRFRVWSPGTICHLVNGVMHHHSLPAVLSLPSKFRSSQVDVLYFVHGVLHREDGPAKVSYIKYQNKTSFNTVEEILSFIQDPTTSITAFTHYSKGKVHNLDGPAEFYEHDNQKNKWYIDGEMMKKREWLIHPRKVTHENKKQIKKQIFDKLKDLNE